MIFLITIHEGDGSQIKIINLKLPFFFIAALYFILFEMLIQVELIKKKYFIFIRNGLKNEVEKAKFDLDDGCPSSSSSIFVSKSSESVIKKMKRS